MKRAHYSRCRRIIAVAGTDDENFVDFVAWLLKVKPEERPTAQEAMAHPWLTQSVYDWPE